MPLAPANYSAGRAGTLGNLAQVVMPVQFVAAQVPASPQLVALAGPPAGSVRIIDFWVTSNSPTVAMTSVTVTLQPHNIALRPTSNIGASQGFSRQVLGVGESVRVANGGAQTGVVAATYYDLPSDNIGLVRALLTNAYQDIIPAPSAGSQRRWLQLPTMTDSPTATATNTQRVIQTRALIFNKDNVSHTAEQELGGVFIARPVLLSVGDHVALTGIMQAPVLPSTGPMRYRTIAAPTAGTVILLGAYETIPL